jgi:Asp-tRNA(Asn)/Glu-tRNA(Gln) amidotransferase A subunit family amidase
MPNDPMRNDPPGAPAGHRPDAAARARQRLARWEPTIRAFVAVDDDAWSVLDTADGPLAGIAAGVKDIVDVRGFATRNGSAACAGAAPAPADAPLVAALRRAGAAIVGKTTSTEFAFVDPTDTRNPHDPSRTPGGSSSGSGAAVGAGVLDIAIATQTAGSLCRPASYCGAVGFKPSYGLFPMQGVTPLAPSFDTVGFIARSVAIAQAGYRAVAHAAAASGTTPGATRDDEAVPVVGLAAIDPAAPTTTAALAARVAAAAALARGGHAVAPVRFAIDFAEIVADHRCVMMHEAARLYGGLLETAGSLLRPHFAGLVREGLAVDARDAAAALRRLHAARDAYWDAVSGFGLLLACAVPGGAPTRAGGTTGYQHLLTPWTVFGGPLVSLPWGVDADGLPLSVMLAGAPGTDALVLAAAARLARDAPPLPVPAPAQDA